MNLHGVCCNEPHTKNTPMRTRILLILVLIAPAAHAQNVSGGSPFIAFTADAPAASRVPVAKPKLEIVVATRTSQFPEISRGGQSRLVECAIPRALPAGPSRER